MALFFFTITLFISGLSWAQETASIPHEPTPAMMVSPKESDKPGETARLLDGTHSLVSSRLSGLANRVDSFFGDKRADDELNRSSIRLAYSYQLRMEQLPVKDFQFRFNLRLPHLEEKFKYSVKKNEADKSSPADSQNPTPLLPPKVVEEEKEPWRFRADTGINVGYPPVVFTRGRIRKNWHLPIFIQRFTGEMGWFSNQGFIQDTSLFHDYDLDDEVLFRISNEQSWTINRKNFVTSHGPSIIHKITDDDAISYNLRVQSKVDHIWYVTNYSASVSYRRNLRDQWLYGELTPALDFPRYRDFRRSPSIMFKLETLFGPR
ncbi:MAG: hypothetical protein K2P81_16685 [Bacteriovoracaceae bacterium]|nr:hypothetical protein [Bacteriovoracaceae bacterium]